LRLLNIRPTTLARFEDALGAQPTGPQ
jgi:hypothetical protein